MPKMCDCPHNRKGRCTLKRNMSADHHCGLPKRTVQVVSFYIEKPEAKA